MEWKIYSVKYDLFKIYTNWDMLINIYDDYDKLRIIR